jgi:ribulose-phosphate 3-epimerase
MADIIPAIIPTSFQDLDSKVSLVAGHVNHVQIDVTDGVFVESKSWPYNGADDMFDELLKEDVALPHWQTMSYEVDLMVSNPSVEVDRWIRAGAHRVIVHVESTDAVKDLALAVRLKYGSIKYAVHGIEFGIAIGAETDIESIFPLLRDQDKDGLELIDFVQVMGIKHIGFQGQPFHEATYERVDKLHDAFPGLPISIDGGVSLDTAPGLIRSGATRLVSGSAVFEAHSIKQAIEDFKSIV